MVWSDRAFRVLWLGSFGLKILRLVRLGFAGSGLGVKLHGIQV